MKLLTGTDVHRRTGIKADFCAEYRIGLAGVRYSGTITLDGCPPSRLSGFMTWNLKSIPPGRAVERSVRESIQFLDVDKLLLGLTKMFQRQQPAIVDRDSVCAGDDCESHEASFATHPLATVSEFLQQAMHASPLAGIAGGQATWLIDTHGYGKGCIGVIAQQWDKPQLLLPDDTTVEQLFGDRQPTVFFRYWCQSSPEAVVQALRLGEPLPPRNVSEA